MNIDMNVQINILPSYGKIFMYLKSRKSKELMWWRPTPVLLPGKSTDGGAWWGAVHGVAKSWTRPSDFTFTFHFHALEKGMATHSSVGESPLAWRIPGMGEPESMGSQRVRHDWSDLAAVAAAAYKVSAICFIYWGASMLCAYIFTIIISSWTDP